MFDFFKKNKKEEIDPTNMRIDQLSVGAFFDYDFESWEVRKEYHYKWEDGSESKEFQVKSVSQTKYLSVEEDDELLITLTEKINPNALVEDLSKEVNQHDRPPKKIQYKGIFYYLSDDSAGLFSENGGEEEELISWTYYDDKEKHTLCIEQWDDDDFEASIGICLEEHEFTNLLPGRS